MKMSVIGIDPGPTTGIVELLWDDRQCQPSRIVQCNDAAALSIVELLVSTNPSVPVFLAVEKFMDGRRSGRGNAPSAGRTTRDMVTTLSVRYTGLACTSLVFRSASEVKPWANDERLNRVGLWSATKGMTHARDAARHALFAAVKLGVPDPLSRRSRPPNKLSTTDEAGSP